MEKKEEKRKRQTKFQRECRTPGMNCFVVDNSTWLVPPKWEGEPQCHCTSASNSTYSCMRSLGQQQGNLYQSNLILSLNFREQEFDVL